MVLSRHLVQFWNNRTQRDRIVVALLGLLCTASVVSRK